MAYRNEFGVEAARRFLQNWLDGSGDASRPGFVVARHPDGNPNSTGPGSQALILSGSFNPLHAGHLEMAKIAEQCAGQADCWFEISIRNVDKSTLNVDQLDRRVQQDFGPFGVVVTGEAKFTEKSGLFPNATFVVGADTIVRFADLRYHGQDSWQLATAISQIADRGCRFLVFGRKIGDKFVDRGNISLPAELLHLCAFIDSEQFSLDISSSQLRSVDGNNRSQER